jgi:hypothetical protein
MLAEQSLTRLNQIQYNLPRFDSISLASTVAGSLSLFVDFFCSYVTSIPTDDGALEESSGAYDELSSLNWKSSEEGDPKVESGSKFGNGTSISTGGVLRESTDAYDELSSLSWKSSGDAIRSGIRGEKSWCL